MHQQLVVEPALLRGWANQVDRAGGDCAHLESYTTTFVPDGDFGRILSSLTHDYERLVRRLTTDLGLMTAGLRGSADALDLAAVRYARADLLAAEGLGQHASGAATGVITIHDVSSSRPQPPTCAPVAMPTLTLGAPVDQVLGMLVSMGAPDVRHELTELLAGDLEKALRQADAWEQAAVALAGMGDNLAHGSAMVAEDWQGAAAFAAQGVTSAWIEALRSHSEVTGRVAGYLRVTVTQARDVAQLVLDALRLIVSVVLAGWTFACVPIFGPVRTARSFWRVLILLWDIKKVHGVFANFLATMRDCLVFAKDCLEDVRLPAAPAVPSAG